MIGELPDGLGAKYAIVCPWVHEQSGGARTGTRVGQRANGALWFHCDHEHCQGRGWPEFRRAVRPQKHISIKFPRAAGNNDTKGIVIRFD